jgi:site-specific DNA-methyltransferase (adenine-specific)
VSTQEIRQGDCLEVLVDLSGVEAIVGDPPANVAFMGRLWDRAHPVKAYVLPCVPRSKAHERELRREEAFIRYWAERYAMAYDIAAPNAIAILWTLPRTSFQTAAALRRAGWTIKDNLVHLFGTGWAKTDNALAPGQEGWLLCVKGKPDLDIDACRVPRGGEDLARVNPGNTPLSWGGTFGHGPNAAQVRKEQGLPPLGSLPKNALLSHCEECVRVGSKVVKGSNVPGPNAGTKSIGYGGSDGLAPGVAQAASFGATESVPAWHCLAGCVCGARSKWDPDRPLPRCPCGEVWRWLCAVAEVNGQSGNLETSGTAKLGKMIHHKPTGHETAYGARTEALSRGYAESGGASRFFNTFSYLSKCASGERHAGCDGLYWRANKKNPFGFDRVTREEWEGLVSDSRPKDRSNSSTTDHGGRKGERARGNVHPTVKSIELMRWLHRLTGAKRIVDLCAGSGSGALAAYLDGLDWIGAELCPEAVDIGRARLAWWQGLSDAAKADYLAGEPLAMPAGVDERQLGLF